jgi:hypothetical protein
MENKLGHSKYPFLGFITLEAEVHECLLMGGFSWELLAVPAFLAATVLLWTLFCPGWPR